MSFLNKVLATSKLYISRDEPQSYLAMRGVFPDQIEALGIGYYPEDVWPPRILGASEDVERWNHWSRKGWRLKGKLVFPVTNARGDVCGIQVRSPSKDQKDYSKFYLDKASIDAVFFGTPVAMPSIWETREVYLCEGLFDLPPLLRVWPNSLCAGTANISRSQVVFLRRYVDRVHIVSDSDWGGDRFWREFKAEHDKHFAYLDRVSFPTKDPAALWESLGEEGFQEFMRRKNLS